MMGSREGDCDLPDVQSESISDELPAGGGIVGAHSSWLTEVESASEERSQPHVSYEDTLDHVVAVACTACSLCIYLRTLYPHVPGGDSGELIASAYQLGIAHPPGYPLFNLMAKIFCSLLFYGNVAWRMNVFAAVVGSCAPGILYLTARRLVLNRWAAVLGCGLFTLNPIVWMYSTHAEVFPLNNTLVAMLLYLTARFHDTKDPKFAFWGAFVMGLGLTNQHTIVLYEAPLALFVIIVGRCTLFKPKPFFSLVVCFFSGFSIYLYLPLATISSPYVSWGNGLTIQGFLRHILRMEYGSFRLSADEKEAGRLLEGLEFFMRNQATSVPPGVPLLAFLGICSAAVRPSSNLTLFIFTLTWAFYLVFFHTLANLPLRNSPFHLAVIQRFWMQSAAVESVLISAGAAKVLGLLAWVMGCRSDLSHAGPPSSTVSAASQPSSVAQNDQMLKASESSDSAESTAAAAASELHNSPAKTTAGQKAHRKEQNKGGRTHGKSSEVQAVGLADTGRSSADVKAASGNVSKFGVWEGMVSCASAAIVLLILAYWFVKNFAVMDQTDNTIVFQFSLEVLRGMPPYALFLTMTDLVTNGLRYVQVCHHTRQDVLVIDQNLMSSEWFVKTQAHNFRGVAFPRHIYWPSRVDGFDMKEFVDNNYGKFRIFTFAGTKDKSHEAAGYRAIPFGYAEEIVRPMDLEHLTPWQVNFSMWAETVPSHIPSTPAYINISLSKYPQSTWEYKAVEEYFFALSRYGTFAFEQAKDYPRSALPACIHIFSQAASDWSGERCNCSLDAQAAVYKHLGTSHFHAAKHGIGDVLQHKFLMREAWEIYVQKVEEGFMDGQEEKDVKNLQEIIRAHDREIAALALEDEPPEPEDQDEYL